ncbi:MAG TPA: Imm26 family immunity protein [Blastocatellia bacterium]|nr:Imm26 family immunity protein [Blastocatellia bacterium]
MSKFKAGDIFTFKLSEDEYLNGRILLDVKEQCIRPRLLRTDSPLVSFNGFLLVEVYKSTFRVPTPGRSETLIPGIFVDPSSLESADWPIIGYEEVDPTRVEFPENLIARGVRGAFLRGEIELPLDLQMQEIRRMRVYPAKKSSLDLAPICLYQLGRKEQIDQTRFSNVGMFNLNHSDLRFSEHRDEIYRLLGESAHQSYDQMSSRLGHDLKRFYRPEDQSSDPRREPGHDETIILCPYCMSPIQEETRDCPRCGKDTTRDARLERTPWEYRTAERVNCRFCGGSLLKLADPCPSCRKPQR